MKATDLEPVLGAPFNTEEYTGGTGTYTPSPGTAYIEIELQAPGGGGARSATAGQAGGGSGGEYQRVRVNAPAAMDYIVGAAGTGATTNGTPGGDAANVTLGHLAVFGGKGGTLISGSQAAAPGGGMSTSSPANGVRGDTVPGGAGGGYWKNGASVANTDGRVAGLPFPPTAATGNVTDPLGGGSGGGNGEGSAHGCPVCLIMKI